MSISASSHKWEAYRWLQKGLDARRERGAYPLRYVTGEQRRRRTLFKPTRRVDGDLADFLSRGRGTRSLRIDLDTLVSTASPARTALLAAHFDRNKVHAISGTGH